MFSARARRRAARQRREAMNEAVTMYGRRAGEDPLQRGAAQQALEYVREQIRKNSSRRRGQQVVNGGTEAMGAAGKEQDAEAMARAAAGMVASNDQRVDGLRDRQAVVRNQYMQAEAAAQEQQAAETAQAAANAVGAIGNAAVTLAGGSGTKSSGTTPKVPLDSVQKEALETSSKDWPEFWEKNKGHFGQ